MIWKEGHIEGVLIEPFKSFSDDRGWLAELFRSDDLSGDDFPAMGYISGTLAGKQRGPHEHVYQSDRFGFFHGHYRLFLWDARKGSTSEGVRCVLDVGLAHSVVVTIPPGVVHAYVNAGSEDAFVLNFPNKLYAGLNRKESVDEIRHEDLENSPYTLD
ncbi:MAG: dTDP-4-dehydrorhamnose 3,5-epimerase family protein [Bacteroidetes bacterium]|nr:dTDP-4-dehydrorhamnose 3,5-epimerase family protein [Bacteroidota bacterium]